jgi:DNA polymerase-3 subunit alpha
LLAFEKESLGFYITGHPLDKYERAVKRLTGGNIVSLREKSSNGEVKVGGVVTGLRLRNTKKGERYASFQLEDRTGFIEVLVWPDLYRRCMDTLVLDDPILIQGRLEVGEERVQIIASNVTPLAQVSGETGPPSPRKIQPKADEEADAVHFYLRGSEVTSHALGRLHDTLLKYPGPCPVFLHVFAPDRGETVIELPEHFRVASTPSLVEAVEQLFGKPVTFTSVQS